MSNGKTTSNNRPAVDILLLMLRVIVGIIFTAHGSQLLFGAFGGPGLANSVKMLDVGWIGYLVVIGQFFGGLGLIFGFLSRFSAASLIIIMIGAIIKVHLKKGFFLQNGGFEYNLALIGLLAPLLILGPGRIAVGRFLPLPRSTGMRRPILVLE